MNNSSRPITEINFLPMNKFQERKKKSAKTNLEKPFVLILGTDEETRFLFKTALEIWNYEVAEAENYAQSLQITKYKSPDLVLMDTEIDLIESLKTMRNLQTHQIFENAGFILISGHAQEYVRQTAIDAGAMVFLVKPVDFELLEQKLKTYFESFS